MTHSIQLPHLYSKKRGVTALACSSWRCGKINSSGALWAKYWRRSNCAQRNTKRSSTEGVTTRGALSGHSLSARCMLHTGAVPLRSRSSSISTSSDVFGGVGSAFCTWRSCACRSNSQRRRSSMARLFTSFFVARLTTTPRRSAISWSFAAFATASNLLRRA